jgi:CRISPR-associated protein Csy3
MSAAVFKKLPGVLSFQRGIVISDALFYNEIDGQYEQHPLPVVRHGIRGTQNVNKGGDGEEGATANTAKRQEVSNIQTTDTAKLAPEADALVVRFSLRFLDFRNALFACAPGPKDGDAEVAALRESIDNFIARAQAADGLLEIGRRYARNIGNGRWLWRNRLIAQKITVDVSRDSEQLASFDALKLPLHDIEKPGLFIFVWKPSGAVRHGWWRREGPAGGSICRWSGKRCSAGDGDCGSHGHGRWRLALGC